MIYLIALLVGIFVLALQYFLSMWLIKIGWFYRYAYFMGGFVLFIFLALTIFMQFYPFLKFNPEKRNDRKEIERKNRQGNAAVLCLVLTFLGGFWINVKFNNFYEKYEYDNFGIKAKAIVTEKYEQQSKNHSYIFILQPQGKTQQKKLRYTVSQGVYKSTKVGDTIAIFYSPRYSSMIKIQ